KGRNDARASPIRHRCIRHCSMRSWASRATILRAAIWGRPECWRRAPAPSCSDRAGPSPTPAGQGAIAGSATPARKDSSAARQAQPPAPDGQRRPTSELLVYARASTDVVAAQPAAGIKPDAQTALGLGALPDVDGRVGCVAQTGQILHRLGEQVAIDLPFGIRPIARSIRVVGLVPWRAEHLLHIGFSGLALGQMLAQVFGAHAVLAADTARAGAG